jgi:hypothetical protein
MKKIDVNSTFEKYRLSPAECQQYLCDVLHSLSSINAIQLEFPQEIRIVTLKEFQVQQKNIFHLFPSVFKKIIGDTHYKASLYNQLQCKLSGIPFSISPSGHMMLGTLSGMDISFIIQLLIYISETNADSYAEESELPGSSSAQFLKHEIHDNYSWGEYVDFVDRSYDQYKHTQLPPDKFHLLFNSFCQHTFDIGNKAFDAYMQTRDWRKSWSEAIAGFMMHLPGINESLATKAATILLD